MSISGIKSNDRSNPSKLYKRNACYRLRQCPSRWLLSWSSLLLPCFKASAPAFLMSWLLRCTLSFSSPLATPSLVPFCFWSWLAFWCGLLPTYTNHPFLLALEKSHFWIPVRESKKGRALDTSFIYVNRWERERIPSFPVWNHSTKASPAQAHVTEAVRTWNHMMKGKARMPSALRLLTTLPPFLFFRISS